MIALVREGNEVLVIVRIDGFFWVRYFQYFVLAVILRLLGKVFESRESRVESGGRCERPFKIWSLDSLWSSLLGNAITSAKVGVLVQSSVALHCFGSTKRTYNVSNTILCNYF